MARATIQTKVGHKILTQMSRKRGAAMDALKSASEIPGFIAQHNLDTKILHRQVKDFRTFNDFFARGMDVDKYRPLSEAQDEAVVVSPADCRLMAWPSILESTKVWIKGNKFTLENLLGADTKIDLKKYRCVHVP